MITWKQKFAHALAIAISIVDMATLRPAYADTNETALRYITDTADKICGVVALAGESQSVTVTGDVKAQLNGLAKRLADLGLRGDGSFDTDSYVGLLRPDLPSALTSIRECKLKVFQVLVDKLIVQPISVPPPAACGGIENAKARYDIPANIYSSNFLLRVPPCGSFTLHTVISDYVRLQGGKYGPEGPPSPHILDINDSLCVQTLSDQNGPFIIIHVDRDCGSRQTPTSNYYFRRPAVNFADPAVSNLRDMVKLMELKNAQLP